MSRHQFTPPCGFDIATTTVAETHDLGAIVYWGYRLVIHPSGTLFIHETYYNKQEAVLGFAASPARPCGDSETEVKTELDLMLEGLKEPVLRYTEYGDPTQDFGRYD